MMMKDNPKVLFVCSIHLLESALRLIRRNAKVAGNIGGANERVRFVKSTFANKTQLVGVAEATGNTLNE